MDISIKMMSVFVSTLSGKAEKDFSEIQML
ncbi:MAG: hypothetical protein ACI9DJ_001090 [Algoriphagus sp.]|jgi:hypothetical protein